MPTAQQITTRQDEIMSQHSIATLLKADNIELNRRAREEAVQQLETEETLTARGYSTKQDYLSDIAEDYNQPYSTVESLADLLGDTELFDGLLIALEDEL